MNFIRHPSYPCSPTGLQVATFISHLTSKCNLVFLLTSLGLGTLALLYCHDSGLTLEPPQQDLAQAPTTLQSNKLFVNPNAGDVTTGNGTESAPFKTITQALASAPPQSVIILASGTYNEASGETFPLKLKSGVSIQGNPGTRGRDIIIQGGGVFLSPTFARQNIAILGANQASITGVTITNSNPRGYGLWIESNNLIVSDNTFTGNTHDGISITGNSAPTIRSNYFYQNGANGMTIYGTSQPVVRENVFEQTGFGINIAQKATPIIIGNKIIQNRSGVIAQANSRPILRDNVIEGNKEDGIVAIASSQPNLGTKAEPGGNLFRQNGRYDINTSSAKEVMPAFGNQITNDRISGKVDLAGTISIAATPAITPQPRKLPVATPRLAISSPANIQVKPPQPTTIATSTPGAIVIPVPPPTASTPVLSPVSSQPQQISLIPISATPASPTQPVLPPPPKTGSISKNSLPVLQAAQVTESELLPVPGANIPLGDSRNLPKASVPSNLPAASAGGPPQPPTITTSLGLRYRVVVEAENESKQAMVRSLVPGAFRTFSNGKVFMQVGAFGDRAKADEMLQMVNSNGLKGTIEQLN